MNIIRLPPGEQAAHSTDRIRVQLAASGHFEWSGMIVREEGVVFGRQAATHSSRADAEADGISWADGNGASYIAVEWG